MFIKYNKFTKIWFLSKVKQIKKKSFKISLGKQQIKKKSKKTHAIHTITNWLMFYSNTITNWLMFYSMKDVL